MGQFPDESNQMDPHESRTSWIKVQMNPTQMVPYPKDSRTWWNKVQLNPIKWIQTKKILNQEFPPDSFVNLIVRDYTYIFCIILFINIINLLILLIS